MHIMAPEEPRSSQKRATPHKQKPTNQPPSLQKETVGSEEMCALWSHAFPEDVYIPVELWVPEKMCRLLRR